MKVSIRPYQEADYKQVLDISNSILIDQRGFSLVTRLTSNRMLRSFVAELCDDPTTIVGYALVHAQDSLNQKIRLEIIIHPHYRRLGIGSSLYRRINQDIEEINPVVIQSRVLEEHPYAVSFLEKRGFHENHRMVHASLSLSDFDESRYLGLEEQLHEHYIEITTLAEEKALDPECLYKLHDLDNDTSPHFPRDQFETFVPQPFDKSTLIHEDGETFFIAKHDKHYVGYSHFKKIDHEQLTQGLTAVLQPYWNKGIATALKVRVLQYGKKHGFKTISTGHRNTNTAMKVVNEQKLGYIPFSSEIRLERYLQ